MYEITYPDGSKRKFDTYKEFENEANQLVDELGLYFSSVDFKELSGPINEEQRMVGPYE